MSTKRLICKVVTIAILVLLLGKPDLSSAALCKDVLYLEECDTWLSGSGIILLEPICSNGTIHWHNCQHNNITLNMQKQEMFRMCFLLDKIPYNIIDMTNSRNVPKKPPKKDKPSCVLSRRTNNKKESLELRFKPSSRGSQFLTNIPFTVERVSLPKLPYG
ncbi:uncharacterized protein LOC132562034 [Ylistrum balloti]|uniref:uncharacterized protein LOC132562034 n=1 Tax=Ylistrum balloti TaxID=509963 RepID=UPI002905F0AA|nr:uncharacterized protein LOC132562034 [Ylistrum balloti]